MWNACGNKQEKTGTRKMVGRFLLKYYGTNRDTIFGLNLDKYLNTGLVISIIMYIKKNRLNKLSLIETGP
jgi:hypothetical protein